MEPAQPADLKYDVGVLLVHGIGQPARRQTLRSFGEPLCRWLERRVQRRPERAWELSISEPPTEGGVPAHCELTIQTKGRVVSQMLLAESCWAHDIAPPTFTQLANWGVRAIPWTLGSHFARRIKRDWERFQFLKDGSLGQQAGGLLRLLGQFGQALAAVLMLAPLLVLLSFVLSVIALLPVPWVGRLLRRLQAFIAARIGDSYALVERHLGGMSAIVGRVRHDARWLTERCRVVAVVGHSQGAAAAHLALRQELERVGLLVTFGSGLRKLEELRLPEHRPRESLYVLFSGVIFLAGLAAVLRGAPGWLAAPLGLAVLLLLLMAAPRLFAGVGEAKLKATYAPIRQRLRWVDYWATSDPVSNGPLFDEPGFVSQAVHNRHSPVTDHTTYWENVDHFVGAVASEIAKLGPKEVADHIPLDDVALERMSAQRQRRIRHLSAFRWTVTLMGLAVGVLEFGQWTIAASELLGAWEAPYPGAAGYAGLVTLAASLAALLLQLLSVGWLWLAWNRSDMVASSQTGTYNQGAGGRRLAWGGGTLVALIGLCVALHGRVGRPGALLLGLELAACAAIVTGVALLLERRHAAWLERQKASETRAVQAPSVPDYVLPDSKE